MYIDCVQPGTTKIITWFVCGASGVAFVNYSVLKYLSVLMSMSCVFILYGMDQANKMLEIYY